MSGSLPRFFVPMRAAGPPKRRLIKVNTRGDTYFAEVAFAPGPPTEGETGENDVSVMFGSSWMLTLWNDWVLELYRWNGSAWERRNPLNHPLFGKGVTLPEGARHVTWCFDQSARLIVAYELDGTIHLTRWDTTTNSYIQNVEAAGRDPLLFMDATVMFVIPGSDVTLFYLSDDRQTLHHRQQSDIYAVEYTDKALGAAYRLDQVVPGNYLAQLYLGDEAGAAAAQPLTVALYPVYAAERFAVSGEGRDGEYELVVVHGEGLEQFTVAAEARDGEYLAPLIEQAEAESPFEVAAAARDGAYESIILTHAASEAFEVDAAAQDGAYALSSIRHSAAETFTVSAEARDGSYELA